MARHRTRRTRVVDVTKSLLASRSATDTITVHLSATQSIQVAEDEMGVTQGSLSAAALRNMGKLDVSLQLCNNWRAGACHSSTGCHFAHVLAYLGAGDVASDTNSRKKAQASGHNDNDDDDDSSSSSTTATRAAAEQQQQQQKLVQSDDAAPCAANERDTMAATTAPPWQQQQQQQHSYTTVAAASTTQHVAAPRSDPWSLHVADAHMATSPVAADAASSNDAMASVGACYSSYNNNNNDSRAMPCTWCPVHTLSDDWHYTSATDACATTATATSPPPAAVVQPLPLPPPPVDEHSSHGSECRSSSNQRTTPARGAHVDADATRAAPCVVNGWPHTVAYTTMTTPTTPPACHLIVDGSSNNNNNVYTSNNNGCSSDSSRNSYSSYTWLADVPCRASPTPPPLTPSPPSSSPPSAHVQYLMQLLTSDVY